MKSSESEWKSLPTQNFSWTRHDEHAAESLQILMIQLFLERLSYQRGKPYATMSKVIMVFEQTLRCFSLVEKTIQTHVFFLSRFLLLNHLEAQSLKAKLLLPLMPIGIVEYAFTLLWDNLCQNSCIFVFSLKKKSEANGLTIHFQGL